jgi:hypothetical protein
VTEKPVAGLDSITAADAGSICWGK